MPRFNLLSTRDRKTLKKEMFSHLNKTAEHAAEITKEEVDNFLKDLDKHSLQWSFSDAKAVIKKGDGKKGRLRYSTYTIIVNHPIYNLLDRGHKLRSQAAKDYGLKAFPIYLARRPEFGNRSATSPNSLALRIPQAEPDVIYRPFIRRPVKPRKFSKLLEQRIEQRLKASGLRNIDIKVSTR